MGGSGYSLFVQDMMQTSTGGALASIQHGGGFGGSGQMASSANGVAKVNACMGNATGTLKPHAWSVITYNAGLHDCDTPERVLPDACAPTSVLLCAPSCAPAPAREAFVSVAFVSRRRHCCFFSISCSLFFFCECFCSFCSFFSFFSSFSARAPLRILHIICFCSRLARPQTAPTSKASSRR